MQFTFNEDLPIYKQLIDQFKLAIATDVYKKGEKIPSVRDLASEIKVNPNTIQRALAELENEKLILTLRTNGKYITEEQKRIEDLKKELANKVLYNCLEELDKLKISNDEIINFIVKNRKEK